MATDKGNKKLDVDLRYACPLTSEVKSEGGYLIMKCNGAEHEGIPAALHAVVMMRVKSDGKIECKDGRLSVRGASSATVFLSAATNFVNYQDVSGDAYAKARCAIEGAWDKQNKKLYDEHKAIYSEQFGRVALHLPSSEFSKKETNVRINEFNKVKDCSLAALMFQYGRYLLISSSQPGSQPANLQGIWNKDLYAPWDSKYTININAEMNYWPAEFSGMGFVTESLYRWIEEKLIPEGRKTARLSYGMKGWVGEIVSNAWGYAAPYWASPIAPCPTGGVWILTHIWEHYLYTGDQRFLEKVFPLVEEAVEFFLEYVYQTESGEYTCGPSISPENSFLYNGNARQISSGCTYEILMIRELFFIYKKASDILKMPKKEQDIKISEIYENLLPYRVLENGCIAEWDHDLPEADPQHRHTSHLLGLFPFAQITPEETPDLCEAAEKTLQRKLTPSENWEDTGWARSMLMLYEARLQHGEKAYAHICHMMEHLLEPNFMVYHPPTRGAGAFDHVYELDGNTGLCSCIGEMLIQSHRGRIRFLPALPKNWKNGKISSFHARGNLEIDLEWREGVFYRAVLKSEIPQNVSIYLEDANCNVRVEKETEITSQDFIKK